MKCPHLTKDVIYTCESPAGAGSLAPKAPRLGKLCKAAGHLACPLYIESIMDVGYYYELDAA